MLLGSGTVLQSLQCGQSKIGKFKYSKLLSHHHSSAYCPYQMATCYRVKRVTIKLQSFFPQGCEFGPGKGEGPAGVPGRTEGLPGSTVT